MNSIPFLTDGGLETTLVFHEGLDLPDFASYPLLETEDGREHLRRYFAPYLAIAERDGTGFVIDTPTWRANLDWGVRLGHDEAALRRINTDAVAFARRIGAETSAETKVNGVIGPRGDGYVVGEVMTPRQAANYHALQARAFADAGADMLSAVTMNYVEEAIGIVVAAQEAGIDPVVAFTVETDGRLPSGQPLPDAIVEVDAATGSGPASFMINCAHPSHFSAVIADGGDWLSRVTAIRANASKMSHEELDEAEELDRGDPDELAEDYRRLRELLPSLQVVGGCCGTDHGHIDAISAVLAA